MSVEDATPANVLGARRRIGEKTFIDDDQKFFAALSGDFNPMHMDAELARRLLTGRQVVHGVHILLNAIEFWLDRHAVALSGLKCVFLNPVSVGDLALFEELPQKGDEYAIEVSVAGVPCCKVNLTTKLTTTSINPASGSNEFLLSQTPIHMDVRSPLELNAAEQLGKKYAMALNSAEFGGKFPLIEKFIGGVRTLALAKLSYFVGMVCPGLNSIFSSLNMDFKPTPEQAERLDFSVDSFDERFGLFSISVRGCAQGEIKAFLRPPPQRQNSVEELRSYTTSGEFSGIVSLVIGGSRGLGELTAKLLASGGGETLITYARGMSDAKAVCDNINASGAGTCELLKFDLLADSFQSIAAFLSRVQAIYFFATPRIFRKKSALFDPTLLQEFLESYVSKFYELCSYLEANRQGKIKIFFPSTVFIESRPREFAEYAMAKSAAEILIADINRTFKKVAVVVSRLPRLSTDQTASVLRSETQSNIDVLLPIVRSMCST